MTLPALAPNDDPRKHSERTNRMIREHNRTPSASGASADLFPPLFALDTGSATAYAIAPVPGIKQYVTGQPIIFKALNANSGAAPTLAVNGLAAGAITWPDGTALGAGDIPANAFVVVVVTSTTPTFHLLTRSALASVVANSGATTFLAADVALNNTGTFFSGPNTGSIGANGQVWLIMAKGNAYDTAGAAQFAAQIYNGSAAIDTVNSTSTGASSIASFALLAVVTLSAATTFTLQVKDPNSTGGVLARSVGTFTTANLNTNITAVRLA